MGVVVQRCFQCLVVRIVARRFAVQLLAARKQDLEDVFPWHQAQRMRWHVRAQGLCQWSAALTGHAQRLGPRRARPGMQSAVVRQQRL
ncbi:hypothetical protein KYG_09220 [Acidovorax sp. NO-1]|nr:hypothetical protein KYG_09220 [Acidovorax sp. NO-1]